jgi:hypothetical protein
MPEPRYDARTVEAPDGTRITVAYRHGSRIGTMSDAQFLAEVHPELVQAAETSDVTPEGLPENVFDINEERLRRHTPGAPFTADELAPLLTGPHPRDTAEQMALLINLVIDRAKHGYQP